MYIITFLVFVMFGFSLNLIGPEAFVDYSVTGEPQTDIKAAFYLGLSLYIIWAIILFVYIAV